MKNIIKKVLVVEDDMTYMSFWKRFLNILGYELVPASTGEEALLKINKMKIDLCILDVVLPGKDGYETLKEILKTKPETPALITTAYGSRFRRFKSLPNKFHLLHKPFTDLNKLQRLIRHLVEGESVFDDADENSYSDSDDYPDITEWSF